jgi:hypothetical protein
MTVVLAIQQVGDKKDRTYRIAQHSANTQPKLFTVKGLGKAFTIFNGNKEVATFKTLTECKQYVGAL